MRAPRKCRPGGEYFPQMLVDRALDFIDRNREQPFLLCLAFNLPHYPEQALREHEKLYENMADPARRSYAAVVTTTDHYIGLVMERLEKLGLREKSIVIFMSDNGHSEETTMRIKMDGHKWCCQARGC
jgi:arylsulfatase A